MKNNFFIILIFCQFFLSSNLYSDEIDFVSSNIKIFDKGDLIVSYYGKAFVKDQKIEIEGDKAVYDKRLSKLTVTNNAKFIDNLKNIYVEGEELIYDKKNNLVYSNGKTFLRIEDTYDVHSKNLYYDRNIMEIYSEENTTIEDEQNNIYNFEENFNLDVTKELLFSNKTNVIDFDNNQYNFEKVKIDLKDKVIVGKEVKVNFIDNFFGIENQDPLLKGRSVVSDNQNTTIYKSIFSTCNTEKRKCRTWELESDIFNHDKEKQIFEYKKSWLKMWGKKVAYFPYFNHPDPTVKRKSGFLTPSYASSSHLGGWLRVPYFKVLSKDKDLTFNPKLYLDNDFIFQTEYRQAFENSFFISDFSYNQNNGSSSNHIFAELKGEVDTKKKNEQITYDAQLQHASNNNYLKLHTLKDTSIIIDDYSTLTSKISVSKNVDDDYNFSSTVSVFEDLTQTNSDKYQYIFPNFSYKKYVDIDESYNGDFTFNSNGFQKLYDSNVYEAAVDNDFLFNSNDFFTFKGIVNNFDLLLRNNNSYSENSTAYLKNNDHELYETILYKSSFPLKKDTNNGTNYLTPVFSARYSPNNTKNISTDTGGLTYGNIYSLNRIGRRDTVESDQSFALGLEFERQNYYGDPTFTFKIAQNFRDSKNSDLPTKSKLGEKRSDFVGEVSYQPNEVLNLNYKFSYDRDLNYSNSDNLGVDLKVNNFITKFNYLFDHNDFDEREILSNTTRINFNDENSLRFLTTRDLKTDFTEYYKMIYNYEIDCLTAELEFNKKFYRDDNIEPTTDMFLLVKFIPFVEVRAKDTGRK